MRFRTENLRHFKKLCHYVKNNYICYIFHMLFVFFFDRTKFVCLMLKKVSLPGLLKCTWLFMLADDWNCNISSLNMVKYDNIKSVKYIQLHQSGYILYKLFIYAKSSKIKSRIGINIASIEFTWSKKILKMMTF